MSIPTSSVVSYSFTVVCAHETVRYGHDDKKQGDLTKVTLFLAFHKKIIHLISKKVKDLSEIVYTSLLFLKYKTNFPSFCHGKIPFRKRSLPACN